MSTNGKVANPALRMIATKKKLIKRLNEEISRINSDAAEEVERVKFRIRQASTILDALERGTLKP